MSDRHHPSEVHRRIGEWYEKVTDASSSPDAVFEAAEHFCRSAEWHLAARDPKGLGRSAEYAEKKCADMLAAAAAIIRTNAYLIQTHSYSRGSCRRLEEVARLRTSVAGQEASGASWADVKTGDVVRRAALDLRLSCVEAMRAIAREVGEDRKAFYRQRMLSSLLQEAGSTYDTAEQRAAASPPAADPRFVEQLKAKPWPKYHDPKAMRWNRWSAMLHIAARSYSCAGNSLAHYIDDRAFEQSDLVAAERWASFEPGQIEARIELVRIVEQAAELRLLELSVLRRIQNLGGASREDKMQRLRESARAQIKRGRRIATGIRDCAPAPEGRGVAVANWCEVRLIMHDGALKLSGARGDRDEVKAALSILSDAEAKLRNADQRKERSELALLDLYRAEVRLAGIASCTLNVPENIRTLGDLLDARRFASMSTSGPKANERMHERFVDMSNCINQSGRRLRSEVTDAVEFLERSEIILRDRRRNVWWTTWYFERKLRAIAFSVLISCGAVGSRIPYLGLEDAMRLSKTEPQELLETAQRMIRVDSYRMATIVESYFGCILALIIRLSLGDAPKLPRRLIGMLRDLERGLITLQSIREARADDHPETRPDNEIDEYIRLVLGGIKECVKSGAFKRGIDLAIGQDDSSGRGELIESIRKACRY